MVQLNVGSLATSGLSSAVGSVALNQLQKMLPASSTTWGNALSYAVPLAAGFGGAWFSGQPGRMSYDIGQGVQAAGFTLLGMKLSQTLVK